MATRKPKAETVLQGRLIEFFEKCGYIVTRVNSGGFRGRSRGARKGTADLIMCSPRGKYVAVEVKTDDGVLSDEQREFLSRIARSGGEWQVVRSLEDARGLVDRLRA